MNKQLNIILDKTAELLPGVYTIEYESGKRGVEFHEEALTKFVELLIETCCEQLLSWQGEPFPFDETLAVSLIREHFYGEEDAR